MKNDFEKIVDLFETIGITFETAGNEAIILSNCGGHFVLSFDKNGKFESQD